MAKGKKVKQPATSKKSEQKKKSQQIEDRTFGLKNKNKSKKVQSFVKSVTNSVNNTGDRKQRAEEERRKRQKAEQKLRKQAMKDEANALFNEALGALNKKKTNFKEGKTEAKGRDADDDGKKKGTSRAMKMMYQMDAKEMEERLREDPNYVPTLEDKIEAERQQKVAELKKNGNKGTPVKPESFAVWQEKKRKRRAEESRKMVEQEMRKKKGGKGLAVLSGRALYEYKKDLFNIESDEIKDSNVDKDNLIDEVARKVESNLFLEGDDDSLDDLDDE